MKKTKRIKLVRNPLVRTMNLHCKGGRMKDWRLPRGGARNKVAAYLAEA